MKLYGLIGFPLGHSFSAQYFNEKFAQLGLHDHEYRLFPLERIQDLPELIKNNPELCGLNITSPYKKEIVKYLHQIGGDAQFTSVVNVLDIHRDEAGNPIITGLNTDIPALRISLKNFIPQHASHALIFGTGASSESAAYVLDAMGISYTRVSRSEYIDHDIISYHQLNSSHFEKADILINTTPAGQFPDTEVMPPFHPDLIKSFHYVFDLIYNPAETRLMREALMRGAKVRNGLEMLYIQADLAWKVWNREI